MSKNKVKSATPTVTVQVIFYLFIAAMLIILILFVIFLYRNFFLTLEETNSILVTKSDLTLDVLNSNLTNKIQKLDAARASQEKIDWRSVRNPFSQ